MNALVPIDQSAREAIAILDQLRAGQPYPELMAALSPNARAALSYCTQRVAAGLPLAKLVVGQMGGGKTTFLRNVERVVRQQGGYPVLHTAHRAGDRTSGKAVTRGLTLFFVGSDESLQAAFEAVGALCWQQPREPGAVTRFIDHHAAHVATQPLAEAVRYIARLGMGGVRPDSKMAQTYSLAIQKWFQGGLNTQIREFMSGCDYTFMGGMGKPEYGYDGRLLQAHFDLYRMTGIYPVWLLDEFESFASLRDTVRDEVLGFMRDILDTVHAGDVKGGHHPGGLIVFATPDGERMIRGYPALSDRLAGSAFFTVTSPTWLTDDFARWQSRDVVSELKVLVERASGLDPMFHGQIAEGLRAMENDQAFWRVADGFLADEAVEPRVRLKGFLCNYLDLMGNGREAFTEHHRALLHRLDERGEAGEPEVTVDPVSLDEEEFAGAGCDLDHGDDEGGETLDGASTNAWAEEEGFEDCESRENREGDDAGDRDVRPDLPDVRKVGKYRYVMELCSERRDRADLESGLVESAQGGVQEEEGSLPCFSFDDEPDFVDEDDDEDTDDLDDVARIFGSREDGLGSDGLRDDDNAWPVSADGGSDALEVVRDQFGATWRDVSPLRRNIVRDLCGQVEEEYLNHQQSQMDDSRVSVNWVERMPSLDVLDSFGALILMRPYRAPGRGRSATGKPEALVKVNSASLLADKLATLCDVGAPYEKVCEALSRNTAFTFIQDDGEPASDSLLERLGHRIQQQLMSLVNGDWHNPVASLYPWLSAESGPNAPWVPIRVPANSLTSVKRLSHKVRRVVMAEMVTSYASGEVSPSIWEGDSDTLSGVLGVGFDQAIKTCCLTAQLAEIDDVLLETGLRLGVCQRIIEHSAVADMFGLAIYNPLDSLASARHFVYQICAEGGLVPDPKLVDRWVLGLYATISPDEGLQTSRSGVFFFRDDRPRFGVLKPRPIRIYDAPLCG